MYSNRNGRIVLSPELFADEFVPEIIGREQQIKEIANCLRPALRGRKPVHCWIHGLPGTGKTSVVRFVLRTLEAETRVKSAYVNCFETDSLHSVLDRILRDMRVLGASQSSAAIKLDSFARAVEGRPFVVVIDEIDQPAPRDRDLILYNIAATGKVGLVAISGSRRTLFRLEPRVRSRLNAHEIHFAPYTAEQVAAILRQRADAALAPKTWTDTLLAQIGELALGDARIALQSLKQAGYLAEASGAQVVAAADARAGLTSSRELSRRYVLERLTPHHRLLHEIISAKGQVLSTDLWAAYLDHSQRQGLKPIAGRTFFVYVNTLSDLGVIKAERADTKGNLRVFRAG